MNEIIPRHYN